MISLPQIAAAVVAVGSIGGGALALDKMHVASEDFKQYIEQQQAADERQYVQEIKRQIRELNYALIENPDEQFLIDSLADLIYELCEIRPDDRLCR